MTEPPEQPTRPVSLITIVLVLAMFSAFFFVVRFFYTPPHMAPQNAAPENLTTDFEWKATSQSRRHTLNELRENEMRKLSSYGWVDQDAGVVHLPIERAMELTVQQYGAKK